MRQGVREKVSVLPEVADEHPDLSWCMVINFKSLPILSIQYNIKKRDDKEDDLRRQQEAEMAAHIAAMNPRNAENKKPGCPPAPGTDDEDFATKLMTGNVSGAAAHVATKMQGFLPQNFSFFKKE